jgi:predicted DsbA family dithiol-disulfide isomerase
MIIVPSYGRRDTSYLSDVNNPRSAIAEAADSLSVEVVSDLICPWCYIGKRRLERAARLLEPKRLDIRWKPFQLNPDMPAEGMDRREYRTRKFGSWAHSQALDAEVVAAGKEVGIAFDYVKMTRTPNTLAGHKLLWLAGEQHCQDGLAEKLFSAYFVEGRNVGDVQVLTDIGVQVGLMPKDIEEALSDVTTTEAMAREEEHARHAGIRGVPTFVVQGKPLGSGAQPEHLLAAVLAKAFAETTVPTCANEGCNIQPRALVPRS